MILNIKRVLRHDIQHRDAFITSCNDVIVFGLWASNLYQIDLFPHMIEARAFG